jgi:hypothetical protein
MSSAATFAVLLKKMEEEMEALKAKQGDHYRQPQRLLGMGSTIPKLAPNRVLGIV